MRAPRIPAALLASAGLLVVLAGCDAAQGALDRAQDAADRATSAATSAAAEAAASSVASTVAATVATAVAATTSSADERTSTFEWKGDVAAGKTLEIRGINGPIEAKLVQGRTATVHATLTGHDSDPTDVRIEVVKHDGNVTLCAVYPNWRDRENTCEPGGGHSSIHNNDVRVDFEVGVPAGVELAAVTVNGHVTAEGLEGPVRAKSVNGSVRVETTDWAEAGSVNGSLHVRMGKTSATDDLSFKTVNGTITVVLPSDAALDVDAATVSGSISTDFPLTLSGRFMNRRARGTIGGGGPEMHLKTVNGSIQLEKGS
jgi:DUF4097 and DUF4098 domain-containing protein YvlB